MDAMNVLFLFGLIVGPTVFIAIPFMRLDYRIADWGKKSYDPYPYERTWVVYIGFFAAMVIGDPPIATVADKYILIAFYVVLGGIAASISQRRAL